MASNYYTKFSQKKVSAGKPPGDRKGGPSKAPAISERTANWVKPGPVWKGSYNEKTKWPVVKTRAAKHGID